MLNASGHILSYILCIDNRRKKEQSFQKECFQNNISYSSFCKLWKGWKNIRSNINVYEYKRCQTKTNAKLKTIHLILQFSQASSMKCEYIKMYSSLITICKCVHFQRRSYWQHWSKVRPPLLQSLKAEGLVVQLAVHSCTQFQYSKAEIKWKVRKTSFLTSSEENNTSILIPFSYLFVSQENYWNLLTYQWQCSVNHEMELSLAAYSEWLNSICSSNLDIPWCKETPRCSVNEEHSPYEHSSMTSVFPHPSWLFLPSVVLPGVKLRFWFLLWSTQYIFWSLLSK